MTVKQKIEADIWEHDRLGFAEIGQSFTNIIQTIDDSKVISIEAPFGYGKTFFCKEWAKQLKAAGELVIEIDALQSDHSGDPLITFMGALLAAQPRSGKPLAKILKDKALKVAGLLGRASMRVVLRESAEEFLQAGAEWVKGKSPDIAKLDDAIDTIKGELTNVAGQLIATHLAAERARVDELPTQIDALRDALTEGGGSKRIVIIVDELDRCHPEYAISLLEAMKLVFGREGFVFVLMVNSNYLERIAKHRFGTGENDELYLEKFIDFRFKLHIDQSSVAQLAYEQIRRINLQLPFGRVANYGVDVAADLAFQVIEQRPSSIRQIKKVLARVELVCRCYQSQPIDMPLLVFLAFAELYPDLRKTGQAVLPRLKLTPEYANVKLQEYQDTDKNLKSFRMMSIEQGFREEFDELYSLPEDRFVYPIAFEGTPPNSWRKIALGLAPHYIPSHQAMLDGVMRLQAD